MRDVVVVDAGHSMAIWEPEVQNYMGFPEGISGTELLEKGREQAKMFGAELVEDEVLDVQGECGSFALTGRRGVIRAKRVLLATGIFHLPPDIPGVKPCTGKSMFYCKDCDGYKVKGKRLAIVGAIDDAVEYALGMLAYSPSVLIATNGEIPHWDEQHQTWLEEYEIPVFTGRVEEVEHDDGLIHSLRFEGGRRVAIDYLFTTRGDMYHIALAKELGVEVSEEREIVVSPKLETSVRGVYAAGCVTPANCQMIIAAGQGATAAQAINRDLFEESLERHTLARMRMVQLQSEKAMPEILD
jgi:thioredoxin reductase (NADPH)